MYRKRNHLELVKKHGCNRKIQGKNNFKISTCPQQLIMSMVKTRKMQDRFLLVLLAKPLVRAMEQSAVKCFDPEI